MDIGDFDSSDSVEIVANGVGGSAGRRLLRRPIFFLLVIAILVAFWVWIPHAEGFQFVERAIRSSPLIHQRVGDVQSVAVAVPGFYRQEWQGTKTSAEMNLEVAGAKGHVTVYAKAEKTQGVWTLVQASLDGVAVNLTGKVPPTQAAKPTPVLAAYHD